jgi:hypothetical protein
MRLPRPWAWTWQIGGAYGAGLPEPCVQGPDRGALKEAGSELAADEIGVLKKDALVVKAAPQLAGKRWLPLPLRRPPS